MNDELRIRLRLTGDQEATQSIGGVGQSIERLNANMLRLGGAAAALYAIPQALSGTVGAAIQAADSITALNNNLKLATGSAKAAGEAYSALFAIAQKSRVSFVELGGTFASITRAGEALGVSQSRLLSVTEAISNAVTVSGGSAESAKDALTQLSQGLASGALRGDELNSVMEATPRLARALADGLGVSIGGLRKLGEEGKITSAAVIRALESQSKVLSGEVANSVMTVSQAMTLLKNSATKIVGDFDAVTGASKSLAENLGSVSRAADSLGSTIKANADTINTTIGVLAGAATAAGIGYVAARVTALATSIGGVTGALVLLRATVASLNPWTLALLAGGAVVGGVVAQHDEYAKTKQGIEEKIKYLERLSETDRKALENSGANPDTNKFFLKAVSERSAKITALQKDLEVYKKAEQEALAPIGSVPSGDTALRREKARIAAQEALNKKDKKEGPSDYEKSVDRGKKLYGDLIAQESGLAPDFAEKWQDLANAHKADAKSVKALELAQKELLSQQPFMKEQEKERQEQAKASIKLYEDEVKAHQEKLKELERSASNEADRMQKLQDEARAAGIAAEQNISLAAAIEEVGLARVRETYASEAANSADGQTLLALQKEIQSREKIVTLINNKDAAAAGETAAKKAAEDWKRAADQIEGSITDALMRGFESGKDFATNLRDTVANMFKTMVLRPIISAIVSPVAGALTGAIGLSGAASAATAAATVNGASAAVNGASMLSGLGGWFTSFGESATQALYSAGEKVYSMGLESIGKSMMGNINEAGGFTAMADKLQAVGDSLGYLNATMLAVDGKWGSAIGAGIGTYFGGPLGSMLGQAVGGWIDNAFGGGHEYTTGQGIQGKFSNGGFAGKNYQTWQNDGSSGFFGIGGSGSSSGTNLSALDAATQTSLSSGFASIQVAAAGMAASLGLDAKKIIGYSQDISIALGADAAANKNAVETLFSNVADGIAAAAAPSISTLAKSGESASATLSRLSSSIITANAWLSMLRQRMFQVSLAGGDAASKLADAFGGLDKLTASSAAFYESYYTSAEKVANSQNSLTKSLANLGLALPTTKDQFKALASSLDLNTDAGRNAYATLLQLAPEFATTADLIDKAAQETAQSLVKSVTGDGKLVPALNATSLSIEGTLRGTAVFVDNMRQIRSVMLDTNSPVLTFGGSVEELSTELTGAQQSSLMLRDQIEDLSGASSRAVIDFESLSYALQNVNTETFVAVVGKVFENLATRISGVIESISTERVAVREAALQIIAPTVMSKQSIRAGIAGVSTTLPSNAGLVQANAVLEAANKRQTNAASALSNAIGNASSAVTAKSDLINYYAAKNQELRSLGAAYSPSGTGISFDNAARFDNAAYNYNAGSNSLNPLNSIGSSGYTNTRTNIFGSVSTTYNPDVNGLMSSSTFRQLNQILAGGNAALASAARNIVTTQQAVSAAQTASASAAVAQKDAATAATSALLTYQQALQNFALDAGKSVSKLSRLREETVKYYEAQKALADVMRASADNLLATVSNYRFQQLTPEQQSASLQSQFSTAYSMALSSQADGNTMASYADKLNGMLGPLIDSLKATGQDGLINGFLAQSEAVAKLLQDNAPKNYAADSLAMLGDIDATLAALDASTKSAERIISDAITAGSDRTAAGLHAVIAAITGQSIPAFATGAAFAGGGVVKRPSLFNMAQMGEAGPEAIMPLTNINGSLGVRMAGGGMDDAVIELRALRREVADMRAETRATAIATGKTAKILERVSPDGSSIQTVAA